MLNSFNWKFCVLIQLSWNFVGLLSKSSRQWFFPFANIQGDNWHVLWFFTGTWHFGRHCLWKVFQTLHDYNFARGLAVLTRFDDLDLISRPQVCQNYKLQTVFRFLPTIDQWCMVATYMRKIKRCVLCVTVVYLRDITSTFFPLQLCT